MKYSCYQVCYSWLVCSLVFWLRDASLVKVGNPISDGYGGRAFSQKRWSDLCCDFEKEEEKNNFSSKIRENILKPYIKF